MTRERKTVEDLRQMIYDGLAVPPEARRLSPITIYPMNDRWRAVSSRSDTDFQNRVIEASILLAERFDLES